MMAMPRGMVEMNDKRAEVAKIALLSFARKFGETDEVGELGVFKEQNLVDLLADLAHYCNRQNINMTRCWEKAQSHYAGETNNAGRQFP